MDTTIASPFTDQDEDLKRKLGIYPLHASVTPPIMAAPDMGQKSDLSIPSVLKSATPKVQAPRGTVEGDEARRTEIAGQKPALENVYGKITGSDFGQNHPIASKILGGLAQIPATALDIGLSAGVPRIGGAIPGTSENRGLKLEGLNKQIGEEETEREKEAQTQAQQSEIPLHQAQTREADARATSLENPQPAPKEEHWTITPEYTGPNGEPVEVEQNSGQMRVAGQPTSFKRVEKPEKEGNDFEQYYKQYLADNKLPDSSKNRLDAEAKFAAAKQPPQRPPQVFFYAPNGQGGFTPSLVKPGQDIKPGSVSAAGLNSLDIPTSQTRTMAETAPKVLDLSKRIRTLIGQQEQSLGPAASRWNEFMAGKVGAPNPDFTKLRVDVGLLQTALMRMHVGAKGGEQMMEHFRDLIDASKQDPQNLYAALDEIDAYAQAVQNEGGPKNAEPPAQGENSEEWVRDPITKKLVKKGGQ